MSGNVRSGPHFNLMGYLTLGVAARMPGFQLRSFRGQVNVVIIEGQLWERYEEKVTEEAS